jgi:HAD superfamily hydrolase (TIGR01509 family)
LTGRRTLLIFDCDGVLVDSELVEHGVDAELLKRFGLVATPAELMERFVGVSRRDMYEELFSQISQSLPPDLLDERERMVWQRCHSDLRAIAGIEQALDALREWPKCVASSSLPEKLRMKLANTGLARHFEPHLFSTALVARGKPAPDIYLHAASVVGYSAVNCVVMEDSPAGVVGAKKAGMKVVGFVGASHATASLGPSLIDAGADVLAISADDILNAVRSLWAKRKPPSRDGGGR